MCISNSLLVSDNSLKIFLIIRLSNTRGKNIKVDPSVIWSHNTVQSIDSWRRSREIPKIHFIQHAGEFGSWLKSVKNMGILSLFKFPFFF